MEEEKREFDVEFGHDEDLEEKLKKIKLGEGSEEPEIYEGEKGGQYKIVDGKRVYLRGKGKETKEPTVKLPTKVDLSKYNSHPLTITIDVLMKGINYVVNNTLLKDKAQLTDSDISNCQVGEGVTYTVEHTVKVNQNSPWMVMFGCIAGYGGRIAVLATSGKVKKTSELADGQIGLDKKVK